MLEKLNIGVFFREFVKGGDEVNKSKRALFTPWWLYACLFVLCASCVHDPSLTTNAAGDPIWRHGALSFNPAGEWGRVGRKGTAWQFGHVSGMVWSMIFVNPRQPGLSRDDLRKQALSAMSYVGYDGSCTEGVIGKQPVLFCQGLCDGPLGSVRTKQGLNYRSPNEVVPISYKMLVSDGPDARYVVIVYIVETDTASYQDVVDRFIGSFRISS